MASLAGGTSWAMNNVNVATITLTTPACLAGGTGTIAISAQGGVPPYKINLVNNVAPSDPNYYNMTLTTPNTPPNTFTFTDLPLFTNPDEEAGNYYYTITDSLGNANTNDVLKNGIILYPQDNPITLSEMLSLSCTGGSPTLTITASGAAGGTYSFTSTVMTIDSGTIKNSPQTFVYPNSVQTAPLTPGYYNFFIEGLNSLCSTTNSATLIAINILAPLESTIVVPTPTVTNVSCYGLSDGAIMVSGVTGGSDFYLYSINGGTTFQTSGSFTGLSAGMYSVVVEDSNFCRSSPQLVTISQPSQVTISSITPTSPACFGESNGSVSFNVSGGTGPYTVCETTTSTCVSGITGSGTLSGLAAGSYMLQATDANGCVSSSYPFMITQPTQVQLGNIVSTSPKCFGESNGSVSFNVSGGTAPYTVCETTTSTCVSGVTGSGTLSGLAAGSSYMLQATDANGCVSSIYPFVITQPTQVQLGNIVSTSPRCFGESNGSVSFNVSGGTAPYTVCETTTSTCVSGVTGSGTLSGLAAGSYMLEAIDANGCVSSSYPFVITQPTQVQLGNIVSTSPKCFGESNGSVSFNVSGGTAPYTVCETTTSTCVSGVTGSGTLSGLAAGSSYMLQATDANACVSSSYPFMITQPSQITISSITPTSPACFGESNGSVSFNVSGGTAPYTVCETTTSTCVSGVTGSGTLSGLAAGSSYMLQATDANGCVSSSYPFVITQPSQITISSITPTSPACFGESNGSVSFNVSGGTAPYTVCETTTSRCVSGITGSGTLSGLAAGSYMLQATDANGCVSSSYPFVITQPSQITFTVGVTNVTSFGGSDGSITVSNVMGGSGSYMYSIGSGFQTSPTFPGLIAGMYTVTVRDDSSGCTSQQSVTITSPSPTTSSAGVTNLTCIGRSNNNSCTVLSRYWLKSRSIPSAEKSINVASSANANRRKVQSRYWQKSAPIASAAGVAKGTTHLSGGSNANRSNIRSR